MNLKPEGKSSGDTSGQNQDYGPMGRGRHLFTIPFTVMQGFCVPACSSPITAMLVNGRTISFHVACYTGGPRTRSLSLVQNDRSFFLLATANATLPLKRPKLPRWLHEKDVNSFESTDLYT